MIDYTSILTPDISARKREIALLGRDVANKIPVSVLRSVLAPYHPKSINSWKKKQLIELWESTIESYESIVTSTPLFVSDVRDAINPYMVDRWLEMGIDGFQLELASSLKGLAVSTQKREFTNLRKILANSSHPLASQISEASLTWGRKVTAIANTNTKENISHNLNNLVPVSRSEMGEWVEGIMVQNKIRFDEAVWVLSLCTGRRSIEIMARGNFVFNQNGTFEFSGQAKTRGTHDIGTVTLPLLFLSKEQAEILYSIIEPHRLPSDCDERAVNQKFSTLLGRCKNKYPITEPKIKSGRDLYAALIVDEEKTSNTHPMVRVSELLGHKPGLIPTTAFNYQKYRITD